MSTEELKAVLRENFGPQLSISGIWLEFSGPTPLLMKTSLNVSQLNELLQSLVKMSSTSWQSTQSKHDA